MIDNNNQNKDNVISNNNKEGNNNKLMENLMNLNEKKDNDKSSIENSIEYPKQKKQRLSLVFGIGEKSPFKFNEKVLGNDHMKYISPTITPDNRKVYRKSEIQFSNQPLISPLEEEQLQENIKTKNNITVPGEKEKKKIIKVNKNDFLKKKGKNKYELQFKESKCNKNGISQIIKDNTFYFSNSNSTDNYSKINNNSMNDNLNAKDPIDIIIVDEDGKESKAIDEILLNKNVNDKNNIENNNIEVIDSQKNNNMVDDLEPSSADLFKDTEDDILLSSKLSNDNCLDVKEEHNVKLINNEDVEDIIVSSIDLKNDKEKVIIISDISSNLSTKDNIKIKDMPNSEVNIEEGNKLSCSNYVNNYNFDNYGNQMLMDNSQNDDIIFNNSQINDIDCSEKLHSLNNINIKENLLDNNKELLIPNNDKSNHNSSLIKVHVQNKQKSKNNMSDNNMLITEEVMTNKDGGNLINNESMLLNKHIKNENVVKKENYLQINSDFKDLKKSKEEKFDDNIISKTISNDNINNTSGKSIITQQIKKDNVVSIKLENSIIKNEKIVLDKEKKDNDQKKVIPFCDKLSNELKDDSSSSLSKNSSNSNFFNSNNSLNVKNREYSLEISRLKSLLIPSKNNKNKQCFDEASCHCLHLNKNIKKIVVGKYTNNTHKNWLVMETEKSIEIWKYDTHLDSLDNNNYCNWTKFSERLKNFCEEIIDIKISPTNEYIVIIGSNYNNKSKNNYYRCGLIIDIYTLNEIYLDIEINDTENTTINENLNFECSNNYLFSKICFPLSEYNIKNSELNYEEGCNKLFVPGYKCGQLIEFKIKNNLSKIENYTYPIPKDSSSPLMHIISYDNNNNPSIIGLMKEKLVIWNVKTKEVSSEILLSSIPINGNIKFISSVIPPIEYLIRLDKRNHNNNNTISIESYHIVNKYYSIIFYSKYNNDGINKEKEGLTKSNNLKNENFGIFTFLNNVLKDSIFYRTSLVNNNLY
ncbi:hypothetical protein PIROE2DRAFT_3324 [Piromyces sp. E2]|nr:hypothetical protein PIROE2DRAFT_3324 [Piromyces sp. E2]|eukprot:OUM68804.1 hypothetical protein PIROE2DRAFT_3324 [Piromyces sp. E2]